MNALRCTICSARYQRSTEGAGVESGYAVEIVDQGSTVARRDMIPLCPRCHKQMLEHPARTATATVYLGFGRSGYHVPDAGDQRHLP